MDEHREIITYCGECKDPIYEGDKYKYSKRLNTFVHFDEHNPLKNCYYEEE